MGSRDFDAARKERLRNRDPITFVVGKQTFTCLPVIPLGLAFDLHDAPEIYADAAAAATALNRFIESVLVDDNEVARWQEALRLREEPLDAASLFEIVVWLSEEYMGRPTSPSTDSSGGRAEAGTTSSSPPSEAG